MDEIIVFVEGPSDSGFVDCIMKRFGVSSKTLIMRGNRPGKLLRYVKVYHNKARKVVVLKDLHGRSQAEIERLVNEITSKIRQLTNLHVSVIVVRKSIESWFLSDPKVIEKVFGCRIEVGNPEEIADPSSFLNEELMKRCGKRYVKSRENSRKIAEAIELMRF